MYIDFFKQLKSQTLIHYSPIIFTFTAFIHNVTGEGGIYNILIFLQFLTFLNMWINFSNMYIYRYVNLYHRTWMIITIALEYVYEYKYMHFLNLLN